MPATIELFAHSVASAPDPALLASLRARIGRIGCGASAERPREALPLGVPAIDAVLPGGGLPRGCLHEIVAADPSAAASGFAAVLLARLAGDGGAVWCRRDPGRHGAKPLRTGARRLRPRSAPTAGGAHPARHGRAVGDGGRSAWRRRRGGIGRSRRRPADRDAPAAAGGGDERHDRSAAPPVRRRRRRLGDQPLAGGIRAERAPHPAPLPQAGEGGPLTSTLSSGERESNGTRRKVPHPPAARVSPSPAGRGLG